MVSRSQAISSTIARNVPPKLTGRFFKAGVTSPKAAADNSKLSGEQARLVFQARPHCPFTCTACTLPSISAASKPLSNFWGANVQVKSLSCAFGTVTRAIWPCHKRPLTPTKLSSGLSLVTCCVKKLKGAKAIKDTVKLVRPANTHNTCFFIVLRSTACLLSPELPPE